MAQIELTWIGQHRFLGIDSTGHTVVLSPGADIGVKPAETLLVALAACTAYDVVEILHKQRAGLEHLLIQATGDQAAEPPWAYQRIHLGFQVIAPGVQLAQLERAVDLALNKYCSVRASLAPEIAVTFAVELRTPSTDLQPSVRSRNHMEQHTYGISIKTPLDYTAAIDAVTAALKTEGFGVLTEIDVQATLKQKLGAEVPPYTILGACNPPLAHRALAAEPEIGLLLPCNVIVYVAADGRTRISAIDPEAQFQIVGRADLAPLAREVGERLRRALAQLAENEERIAEG